MGFEIGLTGSIASLFCILLIRFLGEKPPNYTIGFVLVGGFFVGIALIFVGAFMAIWGL